jgi:2Fe-2S ferredoxin
LIELNNLFGGYKVNGYWLKANMKNILPMAKILIENIFGKILLVQDTQKTLLQHFHDHRIDWMQACGGKGRCTSCKVIILSGHENFEPVTQAELKYRIQNALKDNERLSCQAKIRGDISISAPDEYKLPHVGYSD